MYCVVRISTTWVDWLLARQCNFKKKTKYSETQRVYYDSLTVATIRPMSCINNTNFTQGSCLVVSGLMSLYTRWSVSRGATCILTQSSSQYVSRVSSQYVSRVTPLHHKSRPSMRRDYSHLERWLVGLQAANTCQYSNSKASELKLFHPHWSRNKTLLSTPSTACALCTGHLVSILCLNASIYFACQ